MTEGFWQEAVLSGRGVCPNGALARLERLPCVMSGFITGAWGVYWNAVRAMMVFFIFNFVRLFTYPVLEFVF